jgi:hypothetical protein
LNNHLEIDSLDIIKRRLIQPSASWVRLTAIKAVRR